VVAADALQSPHTHKDGRTYYEHDGVKAKTCGGCGPMAMELERKVEE
jgi:hypothetical protein